MGQLFPLPIPVRIVFLVSTYANYVHSSNGRSSSRSISTSLRTPKLSGVLSTALKCPVPFPPSLAHSLAVVFLSHLMSLSLKLGMIGGRTTSAVGEGGSKFAKLRVNITMALRILFLGLLPFLDPSSQNIRPDS